MAIRSGRDGADSVPSLRHELRLWSRGYRTVAGIDEAGRGAWAGPVVAAAVVLGPRLADAYACLSPVRDSKLLSPRQRDLCYDLVLDSASYWGVGSASASVIDQIGIVAATRMAMGQAVGAMLQRADYLLIDALRLPALDVPQLAIIKGDRTCLSIAAASILAKVTRDRAMEELERAVPGYGLARHKGYGTSLHQEALAERGPSQIHRYSFAPIASLTGSGCDD